MKRLCDWFGHKLPAGMRHATLERDDVNDHRFARCPRCHLLFWVTDR